MVKYGIYTAGLGVQFSLSPTRGNSLMVKY